MNPISAIAIVGDEEASSIQTPMIGNCAPCFPEKKEEISLYFHIPFCAKKCSYCHFYVLPDREELKNKWLQGAIKEWRLAAPSLQDKEIATIYFGGGTPSLLGPFLLEKLLCRIRQDVRLPSSLEMTLEANPEDISFEAAKRYAELGVNRISLGVQTLDDSLLQTLGRLHSARKAIEAVYSIERAGIDNLSIDLMYDLPGQTLAIWENTLCRARSLPLAHLSLYNLTIEPHTIFFKRRHAIRAALPDEETSLRMYEMAIAELEAAGLKQYEISAFAKEGFYSRHNTGYWTDRSFLGFGPSAFSFWEGRRFRNIAHLSKYCQALEEGKSPIDFEERLVAEDKRRETLALALRLRQGVNLALFQQRQGALDKDVLDALEELIKKGWIQRKGETIFLSKQGVLFYDSVAVELI